MDELIAQLAALLKGIWKYRWYALAVAFPILIGGGAVVYTLPNNYQASARVFVDTQSILKPILAGMTSIPNVEQQVSIMSRTLLSRPNVERVMRMADLDIKTQSVKEKEALVNDLINQLKIGGTASNDIYSISYNNADPKLAKNVVQSLLTIFIEGSFGDKRQDSDNAVRFIDEQIKLYEQKLVAGENALKEFRLKNNNLTAGKEGDYGAKLAETTEMLNQAKLALIEAEQARNSIKNEIAGEEPILEGEAAQQTQAAPVNPELDARIAALQKNLDMLRTQFTDQHPDIAATKRLIDQLDERKRQEAKQRGSAPPVIGKNYTPVMQQLKIALSDAEARVASIRARVDEYSARVVRLRSMGSAVPEVEAELAQLNRDYQINKSNYEKLVASREAAKLSGNLSATTEMMSFRIIDPPTVPLKPVGPNRPRLFSMVFAGAVLAGLGVAFLISQVRPTYLSHAQLRALTGLPVLGSISMNWTDKEKSRRQRGLIAFGTVLTALIITFGGLMGMMLVKT
jgi:polysaccharide chain length determinant protein (PEP-CTERM system associated)